MNQIKINLEFGGSLLPVEKNDVGIPFQPDLLDSSAA